MKKLILVLATLLLTGVMFAQNSLPFSKGICLPLYFETWTDDGCSPDEFYFNTPPLNLNKYDEADFACFKSMGIEVIRLICSFDLYTDKPIGYGTIYDDVLKRLDQVCDWAEKYQIYLIIDNHNNHIYNQERNRSNLKKLQPQLESVWTQLAPRYKDRSEYIIYEIMNEPPTREASKWYKMQEEMIKLIRKYDSKHSIVVTCAPWSHMEDLVKMKPYSDSNLIYTFHFAVPEVFVSQGAIWKDGAITDLKGLPFPYDKARIPKLEGRTKNSWVKDYIQNQYRTEGTEKFVTQKLDTVGKWAAKNNVKVLCGELGSTVYIEHEDRLNWIRTVVEGCNNNKIAYCNWGIDSDQGFIKTDEIKPGFPDPAEFDADVLEAYGFKMPSSEAVAKINAYYDDFPKKPYVVFDGIGGKGTIADAWHANITKIGDSHEFGVVMSYPQNEGSFRATLPPQITSKFEENENSLVISLDVKFTDKTQSFEVLLADSDGGRKALPWTKRYDLKATDYTLNEWQTIEIPVSSFYDNRGAYSDKEQYWYDLPSEFTWSRFQRLHLNFNDPSGGLRQGNLYIDNIVIKKK